MEDGQEQTEQEEGTSRQPSWKGREHVIAKVGIRTKTGLCP